MKRLIVPAILAALALPAAAQTQATVQQQRSAQATQKGCADKAQHKQARKTREKRDNQKTPKAS
jgi:hypothetical protein